MKEKKNLIIIVLLIVFVLLNIYVYINKNKDIVYIGSTTKIEVNKDEIKVINKNKKLNLTKARIYFNKDFIEGYIKSDKGEINNKEITYNAYDNDGVRLHFIDDLIAIVGDTKIKVADVNISDLSLSNDSEIIDNFLKSDDGNGITLDYSISFLDYKKAIYDIDNDGENEYIYSIDVLEEDKIDYSYVFIYDNNEYKLIDSEKGDVDNVNLNKISFFNLIDFNNDNKYEIVLKHKTGTYGSNCYKVYSYNDEIKEIK